MIISFLSILLTFGVVVFVHELGHFLIAKKSGVKVYVFSLGFGPEIFGITHEGVRYRLSAIPIGGYVKMKGENPEEDDSRDADAYMGLEPFRRIGVIVAGPFMNFFTGMILFSLVMYAWGMPRFVDRPVIGGVGEGSPALEAGIQEGDRVITINGESVDTWLALSNAIARSGTEEIGLLIERGSEKLTLKVVPRMNKDAGRVLIGISAPFEYVKLSFFRSLWEGASYTLILCWRLVEALYLMIAGKMAAAIAGPVGIAQIVSKAANEGLVHLVQLIALISVNLGFVNLFPIPILDGGHVVFAIVEKIKGAPLDPKKVNIANIMGLSFILAVFIFFTWHDITRIVFK